jgi:hypothetical protein
VKSQFDPNQSFHLAAVAAVTDLLDGRPQDAPEYAVINVWGKINPSPFIFAFIFGQWPSMAIPHGKYKT